MIPATVDISPCGTSCAVPLSAGEGASAEETLTDDWLSCLNFSDLPPASSTPADLTELLELDCTGSLDISDLLIPEENPPSSNSSEVHRVFFDPFEAFSSILEPNKAGGDGHQLEATFTCEAASPSFHNDGSSVSSPHNSDAGSSGALAAEGVSFHDKSLDNHLKGPDSHGRASKHSTNNSIAASRKRQHEDIGSDMEGGDGEGKLQLDPSDRKQQRLLRNRELAFESRQRKKCYIRDLESKCKLLEQERNQLQQQVCFTMAENAVLKEELSRAKMKGRDGVTEPAVLFEGSLPLEFLSLLICLLLIAQLSLCGSPFLVLVLRVVVCPQSPSKAEGPVKEGEDRKWCFIFMNEDIRWSLYHLWFHKPFQVCGLFHGAGAFPIFDTKVS